MPNAVTDAEQAAGAATEREEDDPAGETPNWRIVPGMPLTKVRFLEGEDLPPRLTSQMLDVGVAKEHKPFAFTAIGSNKSVDSYGTRMMDSSLKNYAADAQDGRSLLDSHRYRELPIGKTYDGRFMDGRGGGTGKRAEMDVYMLPGHTAGRGGDTDSIINHIRAGIYSDVSIGFDGGKMNCSLCGNEMMDSFFAWLMYDDDSTRTDICTHIPGVEYDVKDKNGKATGERATAVGEIEDAHLLELSIVYDGATPGAAIVKARSMSEYGLLDAPSARQLESIYARERVRFPHVQRVHVPRARPASADAAAAVEPRDASKPGDREVTMPPEPNGTTAAPDPLESIRVALREVGWAPEGEWTGDAAAIATAIRAKAKTAKDMEPDAAAGRQYKADLVEFAIKEGIRARGDKFNREKWEPILKASTPDTIRLYMEDWGADVQGFFVGGRATVEGDEQPKPTAEAAARVPRHTPFSAFTG